MLTTTLSNVSPLKISLRTNHYPNSCRNFILMPRQAQKVGRKKEQKIPWNDFWFKSFFWPICASEWQLTVCFDLAYEMWITPKRRIAKICSFWIKRRIALIKVLVYSWRIQLRFQRFDQNSRFWNKSFESLRFFLSEWLKINRFKKIELVSVCLHSIEFGDCRLLLQNFFVKTVFFWF